MTGATVGPTGQALHGCHGACCPRHRGDGLLCLEITVTECLQNSALNRDFGEESSREPVAETCLTSENLLRPHRTTMSTLVG